MLLRRIKRHVEGECGYKSDTKLGEKLGGLGKLYAFGYFCVSPLVKTSAHSNEEPLFDGSADSGRRDAGFTKLRSSCECAYRANFESAIRLCHQPQMLQKLTLIKVYMSFCNKREGGVKSQGVSRKRGD
ncbi:MAG: hypothetical protein WBA35_00815 [Litorimonas sp.]